MVFVDLQPPATVGGETGGLQIETAGGAGAADRIERLLGVDGLHAVEMKPDARATLILDDLQIVDTFVEPQRGPVLA